MVFNFRRSDLYTEYMCRGRINTAHYVLKGCLWQDAKREEKVEWMDILGLFTGTHFYRHCSTLYILSQGPTQLASVIGPRTNVRFMNTVLAM